MNIVDSSAWLEYFADTPKAKHFAQAIEDVDHLIVPTICLLEVFKKVLDQKGEDDAFQSIALMQQGTVMELTASLALDAARLGRSYKLPLADSIIYATTQACEAILWTQDSDFKNLPNVKFFQK